MAFRRKKNSEYINSETFTPMIHPKISELSQWHYIDINKEIEQYDLLYDQLLARFAAVLKQSSHDDLSSFRERDAEIETEYMILREKLIRLIVKNKTVSLHNIDNGARTRITVLEDDQKRIRETINDLQKITGITNEEDNEHVRNQ